MKSILVDPSVIFDLVMSVQRTHRRNRYIASSAVAAIECLLFYEHLVTEDPQVLLAGSLKNKFLDFNFDNYNQAATQLQDVFRFFSPMTVDQDLQAHCYQAALNFLENQLARIDDPDDLRAYEMYDFLPYNLGDEPSVLECRIDAASASDLLDLVKLGPENLRPVFLRLSQILQGKQHPQRAAWALPLLRFLYMQSLQGRKQLHFVPHATKSTLGFGRNSQTIDGRRLSDYCTPSFRDDYERRSTIQLDGKFRQVVIPDLATQLLAGFTEWSRFIDLIIRIREVDAIRELRKSLQHAIDAEPVIASAYIKEVLAAANEITHSLKLDPVLRTIAISVPHLCTDDLKGGQFRNPMLLIHQLHQSAKNAS